ncbi:metallophosphoesterase [Caballeronia sp. LP006]|uniref:metallophosphoesterase family protein n=1 Tax=unclassified Caballeronia TaxID=2646786 RepID=UPI002028BA67|nr:MULTISPECIES: metallophosphoesterase [unclassified Caballeronia]MDR5801823.1 metallophosphoesterase [Caballeronia sp. LZ001]MDR5828705.1 metallophosphoesterase [Caballeronia sp. LP006]
MTHDPKDLPDAQELDDHGKRRRTALSCMAWAGAGVLWTVSGGVPVSSIISSAQAAEKKTSSFSFVQISDSHIGFSKDPNTEPTSTLEEAINRVSAMPKQPAFMIHTGDVTHLSKPAEFDTADQIIRKAGMQVHYVPGEHDVLVEDGNPFFSRLPAQYGRSGDRHWYSFDESGVHFIGLTNVIDLKGGGLGFLGDAQLAWLKADLQGRSSSTPIVVFAHIPLWALYPQWGWGTDDSAQALALFKRFGSVTVLNGHVHQVAQKVEGDMRFYSAMSTAFPQPAPGAASGPGPMKVGADKLRSMLGLREVTHVQGREYLAVVDTPLAGDKA